MKNAVLLAPYFLPRRRVGSWRPFKFAIHLKDFGWQPHIITIQESTGTLTDKERRLLADIPVYKLKSPFDFTQRSGSQIEKKSASQNKAASKKLYDPVLDWIDKNFPIDTWLPLFLLRKKRVMQIVENINPEVIWSTGDPWSSHWLAQKVVQNKELPWIADFRDPWRLGDVNLKKRSDWSNRIDKRAERSVVQHASMLTFTSESTEDLYRKHYADLHPQTATLYNCFDFDLYDEPDQPVAGFENEKLNLLFFGKFRRLSPARPLIDILAVLREKIDQDEMPIAIHSFGTLSEKDREYALKRGVLQYFQAHQPIPAQKALSVLPKADILWLSTEPNRTNIIPAKLWDYLAARRPVLSIAPNPEIANILDRTGAGIQLNYNETQQVAHLLKQSIFAKQQGKLLPIFAAFNQEKINEYKATQITQKLAVIFDQLA